MYRIAEEIMEDFGWQNLSLIPNGVFMEIPSSQIPGEMRVIDVYRAGKNYQKIGFSLIFFTFGRCRN